MKKILNPDQSTWAKLAERGSASYEILENEVRPILKEVKKSGDVALRNFVKNFDKIDVEAFEVTKEEFETANKFVSDELKQAIQQAKYNIAKFHITQKEVVKKIETTDGITCWRKSTPISKIGIYIPSRSTPLYSTILMLGIPANMANCDEIILCSTPNYHGQIHPIILYTASLINIRKVYKVGGAQAIAAMAYGTESIPKVDKIFGPSNEYVSAAKQLVSEEGVAVDFTAGTSELLVIADETANPKFVASDLLAQAEHGADNHVVLLATSEDMIDKVLKEAEKQIEYLPRKKYIVEAFKNSMAIVFNNVMEAVSFSNVYAPEHLILAVENPDIFADRIKAAGSVFLGHFSPESVGDYAAGPNHTLPTHGAAKAFSGVSVDSFVKKITFQQISPKGLRNIGKTVEIMAEAEGLDGHKNAVSVRLEELNKK